ncbi:chromosome partitioning protein [Raineyella antarctica]|uniref:Chromosome partitioning protein n=1 Tax=Raineyella antarctica TaxID=1577474 RepID=A0A1G6GHR4_9ACTN|nr:ParA family protein [Raineyella antarctica]SDB81484.1 chromosome partitioning protein [Raineyella antarctica]
MTHVISVLNMKGGVGKTTVTMMLGEFLAGEFGKKVLLVDMDPQISLSIAMLGESHWSQVNEANATLVPLFLDALIEGRRSAPQFDVIKTRQQNASNVQDVTTVDLLPSSYDVIPLQRHLAVMTVARHSEIKAWDILGPGIAPIIDEYDYVLIDCPPSLEVMTMNALRISEGFVIPTIPDVLSTYGIPLVQEQVGAFAEEVGMEHPRELGIVINKYRMLASIHRSQIVRMRGDASLPQLFEPWIPETGRVSASASDEGFPSLRTKYGWDTYRAMKQLTEGFVRRVEA